MRHPEPKVDKTCKNCGKHFQVHPYRTNTAMYCSRSCATSDKTGSSAPHWKGGNVTLICKYCGKTYSIEPARASASNYCSNSCTSKDNNSGSKSHLWHGGISRIGYPSTFNSEFKKKIRERDNNTCKVCGKYGNHVHHINYVKMDTTPENCITLCLKCHTRTNSNRSYWQNYFHAL